MDVMPHPESKEGKKILKEMGKSVVNTGTLVDASFVCHALLTSFTKSTRQRRNTMIQKQQMSDKKSSGSEYVCSCCGKSGFTSEGNIRNWQVTYNKQGKGEVLCPKCKYVKENTNE